VASAVAEAEWTVPAVETQTDVDQDVAQYLAAVDGCCTVHANATVDAVVAAVAAVVAAAAVAAQVTAAVSQQVSRSRS